MSSLEWKLQGKCAEGDPEEWFADDWRSQDNAKRVCFECPVIRQCRRAGADELWGVWGGETDKERRRKRRAQRG